MKFYNFLCIAVWICCLYIIKTQGQQQYQRVALDIHNNYRNRHRVGALTSSNDLNNRAVQCARYYANKGGIDHSCPYKNGAGENLWAMWGGSPSDTDAARRSTDSWYSEARKHNYNGDYQSGTGHFTQLVWKNSRHLGFGIGRKGNMIVGCALYSPAGNFLGQFRNNVFPPK